MCPLIIFKFCIFVFQTVITCHLPHFKMSITILHGYSWFDPSNLKTAGSDLWGGIIFWVSVATRAEHSFGIRVKQRATLSLRFSYSSPSSHALSISTSKGTFYFFPSGLPVAGQTSEFVNQVLEKTAEGNPTGGLVGLRIPTSKV